MEFFHKPTSFPFMSTRKMWYGLSVILMLISIGSFFGRGLNLAIDFTGGVRIEAAFPQAANIDAVRAALKAEPPRGGSCHIRQRSRRRRRQ